MQNGRGLCSLCPPGGRGLFYVGVTCAEMGVVYANWAWPMPRGRVLTNPLPLLFSFFSSFRDPGSQRALGARVAFEVLLRPGSFRPGPPSLRPPAGLAPPPGLDPAHLEWVTREPGAAVLCGLLVRVE